MFALNDVVIFKREVCIIKDMIRHEKAGECYVLIPLDTSKHSQCSMLVPTTNKMNHLRALITKQEIDELISKFSEIGLLQDKGSNMKGRYQAVMLEDNLPSSLISIIKTANLRIDNRKKLNKKPTNVDEEFLKMAEYYLYHECAIVLHCDISNAKKYFTEQVKLCS